MSTYTHRYIEVLREQIDGAVWQMKDLPSADEHQGEIFKINCYKRPEDVAPYYKSEAVVEDENSKACQWVPLQSVESKWVPVKWYSFLPKNKLFGNKDPYYKPKYVKAKDENGDDIYLKENILWANNGGFIRDDFISTRHFGPSLLSGRGLPEDVSEEVKNDIDSDYAYDKTWATVAEWETIFETEKDKFQAEVLKRFSKEEKKEVLKKLDIIYKTIKDPNYTPPKKKKNDDEEDYFYEDTIEYMFEEEIWKLFNIRMEIDRAEFILEEFADWFDGEKARIIYYLA